MVSVEQPAYARTLELDKYVRDFGVPAILDDTTTQSISPRFLVMQRGLVALSREIGIYIHYFRHFTDDSYAGFQRCFNYIGGTSWRL